MAESMQIFIGLTALVIVFILAMIAAGWWTHRISLGIIRELEYRGATSEEKAVDLPYDKINYLKIGYRDYRPKALEMLVMSDVVCRTPEGLYYLDEDKARAVKQK
ncbi:MAG TPA: hypothetical protein ENN23_04115 [Deltaproteobacteria bacterium]|nr:hypothetical protein [Deltaproteobacteria bacterium]